MSAFELFHFTDRRGARGIGRYGLVLPRYSVALGSSLAWFTDDASLSRVELGLTMTFIAVDRMEFLYRVSDPVSCEPFVAWAKRTKNPFLFRLIDSDRRPDHWFVSEYAVPVRLVRDYLHIPEKAIPMRAR